MGNPKHKISRMRRDKRRTHKQLSLPAQSICPNCQEPKLPHHICTNCGTYRGREILPVEIA
ncbi:MAG: 50S ribosomal protein L32 [Nitrospirae bacterium]|nr:50S ribosomal protein L32 [Nitrospirota bacterium]